MNLYVNCINQLRILKRTLGVDLSKLETAALFRFLDVNGTHVQVQRSNIHR